MSFPDAETPLYDHPLPDIEQWLTDLGCQQDPQQLNCWQVERATWTAQLSLDIEEICVCYSSSGNNQPEVKRSFKYSLSRADVEAAIFSGP